MRHITALRLLLTATVVFGQFSPVRAQHEYTFRYGPPVNGAQWMHDVRLEVSMKTRIRYPSQEPQETISVDHLHQRRKLEILATAPAHVSKVKVTFEKASRKVATSEQVDVSWQSQPVDGQTYFVTREGENLVVTDEHGNIPPDEQRSIVVTSMQAIGRPNPVAKFLHQRTITVGETLHLPAELASDLLGPQNNLSGPQKMPMTLIGVKDIEGTSCGIFSAEIDNSSQNATRNSTRLKGQFAVELDTCRIVSVSFRGPVTFRQSRMIGGKEFAVEAGGTLSVAMQASRVF